MSSIGLFEPDIELYDPRGVVSKGQKAPALKLYRFIPKDGSPNRLLEKWDPWYALERVTEEHAMIADWIRAQEWGENVPGGCWRYIATSRRMKSCRNQLREMVAEWEEDRERND